MMPKSLSLNLLIALFAHVLLLSLVWVGFAVPLPRNGVQFMYGGSFVAPEGFKSADVPEAKPGTFAVRSPDAAFFTPWLQMRNLNKPKT